jgi:UPF0755 protein
MKKILTILVAFIIFSSWFFFGRTSNNLENKNFTINPGEGVNEISRALFKDGFIKNKLIFETYVWLKGLEGKFQAGEHNIAPKMNFWEIVKALTSGTDVKEREIKIIEGWSNEEIAEYLEKEGIVSKKIFLEEAENYKDLPTYNFLSDMPRGSSLEGYLFPDTYRIYTDVPGNEDKENAERTLARHVIKKMLDNFGNKVSQSARDDIKKQGKTLFEILTMASIVENEVASEEDRKMVADIFWRRLSIGMPLQSDATINYITKKNATQPSLDDLEVDSAYNTYKNSGLPKGPIGNPGIDAILATVYPKENNFWYFLTTKDGETIYSKDFEEHKQNKARYLN